MDRKLNEKLEEIILKTKNEITDKLDFGEMEEEEYYDEVKGILKKYGITKSKYHVKLAVNLLYTQNLDRLTGLKYDYISKKNIPLSRETQEDISRLYDILNETRDYVKAKYNNQEITENELNKSIDEYIFHSKLPYKLSRREKARVSGILEVKLKEYIPIKKKEKDEFEEILNKTLK